MAVSDAKQILSAYGPRVGWGGAHLDKLDAILKTLLDQLYADMPVQGQSTRVGSVAMNGSGVTSVAFNASGAAQVTSANAEVYDLTGVGDGGTIIVNPDGNGNETATINFAAGYHTGGATMSTDISGGEDNKLKVAVDGDVDSQTYHEITLVLANCTTGAGIATELQTQIRALGGVYASVTVAFDTDHLVITSVTLGTGSKVRIERSDSFNITEELDLGPDGGTDTDGTGDVVNAAAAAAQEIVDVINADTSGLTASVVGGKVVLTSDTTGEGSSLVIGAGTLDTVLGFTNTSGYYGGLGLGYETDMADVDYYVLPVLSGTAQGSIAGKGLSITSKTTSGFNIACEDNTATDTVDLIIVGTPA